MRALLGQESSYRMKTFARAIAICKDTSDRSLHAMALRDRIALLTYICQYLLTDLSEVGEA